MDHITFQTLVTKLDTNAVSLKEAKAFVARFGVKTTARTKERFIREVSKVVAGSAS